jgi:MraZ protein
MELKTGAAESTLDDKGRVNIPVRFRGYFQGSLYITRGNEKCAMIMTEAMCESFLQSEENPEQPLNQEEREALKYRHIRQIGEVEVDKAGRIAIPSYIRKYANLTKDCLVIRDEYRLFIWDSDTFEAYLEETDALARAAMNKLSSDDIFRVDKNRG